MRAHRLGRLPLVAGDRGAVGVVLGAALAEPARRLPRRRGGRRARRRARRGDAAGCAHLGRSSRSCGSLSLRSSELGFLRARVRLDRRRRPLGNAASWSQRLIYVYIGGRVFPANPVARHRLVRRAAAEGVGAVPRRREARAFRISRRTTSRRRTSLIPQQTYDQVLFELGLVGALLFLRSARSPCARRDGSAGAGRARVRTRSRRSCPPAGRLAHRRHRRRGAVRRDPDHRDLLAHDRLVALAVAVRRARADEPRPRGAREPVDRPRDRPAQRGRRGAARDGARPSSPGWATTCSSSRARSPRARSRWSTSPRSSAAAAPDARAAARAVAARRRGRSAQAAPGARRAPARRPAHAHGQGRRDGPHAARRRGRARPRALVHTFHGHVLRGYFSRRGAAPSAHRAAARLTHRRADRCQRRGAGRPRAARRRAGASSW